MLILITIRIITLILIISNIHWILSKSRRNLLRLIIVGCIIERLIIVWWIIEGLIIVWLFNLRLIIVWSIIKGLIIDEWLSIERLSIERLIIERLIIERLIRNVQIIIDERLIIDEWLGIKRLIIDEWLSIERFIILWIRLLYILIILVDIKSLRSIILNSLQQWLV